MTQPQSVQTPLPHRLTAAPRNMALTAIGRDEDVTKIFDKLMQSVLPLVITGVGGLGKTTVVQLFWQKYENKFDHVVYLTADAFFSDSEARAADNAELFLNAFANNERLINALNVTFSPEQDTLARFIRVVDALERIEGNNLLVIDNVSVAASRYFDHLSELVDWRILFTARDALPNMAHYPLGTLSTDDAVALFNRIYEQQVEKELLSNILRGVNHHTLAIELIAAYAREKNSMIGELEDEINKRGLRQLDKHKVTSTRDGKGKSVIEHLMRTFLMEFDENEAEIMRYFSILPADGTGQDEKLMSEMALSFYFQKRNKISNLHNTLSTLVRLNWLIKQDNDYLCHPVVKEMAFIQLKPDAVNCEKLIQFFNSALNFDDKPYDYKLAMTHFEPFVVEILRGCYDTNRKTTHSDITIATLADGLRNLYWQNGNYYSAFKYSEIIFIIIEFIFGTNHIETAAARSNLALNYQYLSDLNRAKLEMRKSIAIWEKKLDPLDTLLATAYSNLAMIYNDLSDLPNAKLEMEKAIAIQELTLQPNDLKLATSYSNLAIIYCNLDELHKVKIEIRKAIAIQEVQLDPQDLRIAICYTTLGAMYKKLGDLPNAKIEIERAITIEESQLDPKDLGLAISYSNLANIYHELGDLLIAQSIMHNVIEIQESKLDSHHIQLATSYNNLAHLLADMQQFPLAKVYMDKAVTIRQLNLPPTHPHLLDSLKTQQKWAEILRGS